MAKKPPQLADYYIEQRTRSLATVYLTRRDDLIVSEAAEEDGVDLNVAIQGRKGAARRHFGVILRGSRNGLSTEQANALLRPTLEALSNRDFSCPVCLFFFQMANDEGRYTWVSEPIVTDEGSPVLKRHTEAACQELDTNAVNAIAESVIAWYAAFYEQVVEGTRGPRKKSGIEVLHGIIDGEATYFSKHGESPRVLKLPVPQAYELAKLGREHLGDLAGRIIEGGVRVLERDGLLGMKVKLATDQQDFSFE